ncbi:MAG: endolytic transglycosylase MltG [Flavobacteriales bacterium]
MKKKLKIAGVALFLIVLAVGFFFYGKIQSVTAANVLVNSDSPKALFIPSGSQTKDVIDLLQKGDYVSSIENLEWLFDQKNYDGGNVVPGKYTLEPGWTNNQLVNHLRAGRGKQEVKVQFNQIRTKEDLAGRLTRNIEADSSSVAAWLNNSDSIAKFGFNKYTIISMFIPNTYNMDWNTSTHQLMKRMGKEFKRFWTSERVAKAKAMNMTQSEVVTLASIVYWETKLPKDMPKVAGVYVNRLKRGIPLQADPTLIFAAGDFTIKRVLNKHKEIDSPYNTYKYAGLPPGPVLIPPSTYVDAVLNHSKHDYIYFVAKEDFSGESYFAKTLSQHNIYANRFRKALNERGIYK